jgi:ATP/maltotriose-dependent transcriptional regulator MalT
VISLSTVKKHVSNLLGKLGVTSRGQAIARARDWSQLG